jgi:CCR4-NOT transcriptional regulation complex NOT5 subunit
MAREIEEANAADEEEFASAKGSLRGESNYYSVIEYDNLSMLMDGRTTPMTLKKKQEEAMAQAQFNFQKKASGSSRQLAHQVPKNQPASKATPVNTSGFHTNSGKIGTPQNAFASSPTRANLSPIVKAVSPHEVIHTPLPLKYHPLVEVSFQFNLRNS